MAENYEPYHVPQQSRRDKLRVVSHNPDFHQPLFPIYDPSLLSSSDLLAYSTRNNPICVIKEEGVNLMGFPSSSSSSSPSTTRHHHHHNPYNLDPQSALPMNPTCSIQDITTSNNNPLFYSLQTLRDFDHPYGNTDQVGIFKPDQTLALSLSSHHTHQNQSNHSLELNLQRYSSAITAGGGYMVPASVVGGGGGGGGGSTSNEVSRSSVPLGPFTGYATVLKGSRFLKPAQQLLEEFCVVGSRGISSQKMGVDAAIMDPPIECFNATNGSDDPLSSGDGGEGRRKKSRLISLLDEVYRRYKQYYQQMQAVVASFECVAGLGNAAPYANFALKTMSKHFRSLKNAITDQLQFTNKAHGVLSHGKEEAVRFGNADRGVYSPRRVQNSGFADHQPVWRPQRGLPERAVTVLRAWLFEHFLHPYPTDTDKLMLAKQTGLSRSQVSNWFINARVRLWKPMVEEIHMLETKQGQKGGSQRDERTANRLISDHVPLSNNVASDNPSTSAQRFQEVPLKRTRSELPDLPMGSQQPLNLSYNSLSANPHIGVGANMASGSSGVSLTLGLHQNNGMGLSDPFPMNAPQRFGVGLETTNEGYVMGAFETQNRHFGRDVIGGQLLHDFVG